MKNIYLFLISTLFLFACGGTEKTQNITVENLYNIELPGGMKSTDDMNEDASLQYEDFWDDFYVMVIHESKEEFSEALAMIGMQEIIENDLNNYADFVIEGFAEEMDAPPVEIFDKTINSMPAKYANMNIATLTDDMQEEIDVHYTVAVVEGEDNFYQVMIWTLAENQFDYREKIDNIIYSFSEVSEETIN